MSESVSRRAFVTGMIGGASATLVFARWPYLAEAREYATMQQRAEGSTFVFFTREQAAEIAAVAEQILPSDDTPGAREAGAIYFIDYVLAKHEEENRPAYAEGLRQLADAATKRGAERFSALSGDQQVQVLTEMEKSDFFAIVRRHTILGFLGDPRHKGNVGEVGWKHIGFDPQPIYEPPFGYYDGELTKKGGL